MKKFVEKKKTIFLIIVILAVLLIMVYYYFYSSKYEYITEEENFFSELQINNNSIEIEEDIDLKESEEQNKNLISIHIAGAVETEGVVEIEEESRVIDIIEEAGGLTEEADLSDVNLAYMVKDGQKIYIPSIDDEEDIEIISAEMLGSNEEEDDNVIININTATQTELEELPGIGPSIASSIITYRKENGKFNNIEELKNVSGIGEAKYNKVKNNICI